MTTNDFYTYNDLFSNMDLLMVFKDFMKARHDADSVPAMVWIKQMESLSPKQRRKQQLRFMKTHIGSTAPRELNLEFATVKLFDKETLSDADLAAIAEDLEQTLTEGWWAFNTSPLRKRFAQGEFVARPADHRRFKFMTGGRNSDDMIRELLQ